MIELQIGCALIVCLYLFLRLRDEPRRAAFMGRFAVLMAASWIAENSCIHVYKFYAYDPEWFGFIDQVPILIIAIWPVVIHSALDLVSEGRTRGALNVAMVGGLVVLTDAALIEPIAVRSGLWQWFEPGLFEVPPIGIIGWAIFTTIALYVLASRRQVLRMLLLAPLGTHIGLLALWWGLFRHINVTLPDIAVVIAAAGVSLAVIWHHLRHSDDRPSLKVVLLRAPGAAFFFVLLAIHALDYRALSLYALAFALPWVVYVVQSARAQPRESTTTARP